MMEVLFMGIPFPFLLLKNVDRTLAKPPLAGRIGGGICASRGPAVLPKCNVAVQRREAGGGSRNRPGVHGFAGRCMTTLPSRPGRNKKGKARAAFPLGSGAGNESRTRDLNLGKVA